MSVDRQQCADVFEGLKDIAEGRAYLICEKHNYVPGREQQPREGCAECMKIFYWTLLAHTPSWDRGNFMDGVEMAIKHAVEHVEKGTWDFVPDFKIESIEHDES